MLVDAATLMLRGTITVRMIERYRRSRLPAQLVMAMLEDVWTDIDMSIQPRLAATLTRLSDGEPTEVKENG